MVGIKYTEQIDNINEPCFLSLVFSFNLSSII